MAYYQTGYRYRRYKKHSGRKKWIILAAVLAAVVGVFVFFHKNVAGMLYSLSEATVRAAATEAVNDAVSQTLRWNNVDLLARQTVTLSMANLSEACGEGVKVPIGVFTGIEFLAGFGPRVTFQIIPIGSVSCDFRSSFDTAGLNQTLHSIYMDVTAAVSVVMPSKTEEISVVTQVLICESVIVGEIPDAYLKGDIFG